MFPANASPVPRPRIDMHAHFYGGGLAEMLRARAGRPCLRPLPDGGEAMQAMNGAFPFKAAYHDPLVGLAAMREAGLTRRLLTFPGALGVDVLPAAEVAPAIRAFNDHLAALRAETGGALTGLAGLPLTDMALAAAEVRRIRRDLRLPGIILPGNWFDSIAAVRELAPVLAAADETGALVMVHPGLRPDEEPPPPPADHMQYRTSAVALHAQIAQTVLTLVLSDLLDAFPRVRFQVVNLGGTIPFIAERMEAIGRHRNPDLPFPAERLRRLWYDCASLGPRALETAVRVLGPDRIMMGSDFPIFCDDPWTRAVLPADLDPETKEKIGGGNAAALLDELEA